MRRPPVLWFFLGMLGLLGTLPMVMFAVQRVLDNDPVAALLWLALALGAGALGVRWLRRSR